MGQKKFFMGTVWEVVIMDRRSRRLLDSIKVIAATHGAAVTRATGHFKSLGYRDFDISSTSVFSHNVVL